MFTITFTFRRRKQTEEYRKIYHSEKFNIYNNNKIITMLFMTMLIFDNRSGIVNRISSMCQFMT